ncbi:putative DNA topoisomerase [Nadsonia fulvescens var. elongata DSM 6958]|uniref:DNA topoisomerase I n=1 Tax=Nadsonia fulvescens var. elongata DSM 6958 TaxID=857566 RepID=A0A1E3PTY7_9ASCO|nr:putative DNA topoisomerase [Nadsonia fulvescens var. elongata DSM 6958]
MSSSEDDIPLSKSSYGRAKISPIKAESDSEDDMPLVRKSRPRNVSTSYKEDDSEEEYKEKAVAANGSKRKALSQATKVNGNAKKAKPTVARVKKETSVTPAKSPTSKMLAKKTSVAKVKKESTPVKSGEDQDQEDEEEIFKWWEQDKEDDTIKWTTLQHSGVLFPPPYEKLPKSIKLFYDGQPIDLEPEAEEVAGFFGAMIETDHARNPVFQKNFFNDFVALIKKLGPGKEAKNSKTKETVNLINFSKCDFTKIYAHFEKLKQEKKSISTAEKKKIKLTRDASEEKFKVCYLDGRKELVGNFRIEPPGLFRGRGAHPKTGKLKERVLPEQITLNIGAEAEVPEPPKGHQWGEVKNDNTVSWLATWKENINGTTKYVFLAQNSSLKGMSDFKKFEKARELKNYIEKIREDYMKELKSELMASRQIATATYLIDQLALRAGGEKGEDEADTVGCCSLRFEHITLKPPHTVVFDFLGKDSIRFHQEVEVIPQVFKNLKIFKKEPKKIGDDIFDRLDPAILNKHLQNYMPGLTAKVFRTYNATKTMQDQLDFIKNVGTVNEKVVAYNAANRTVAILCNHQRTVAKTHEASVGKIEDKITELVWQKNQLKKTILLLDKSEKKRRPEFFEDMDSLDRETIQQIHERLLERESEKITKKFARDNEKLKAEGEPVMKQTDLKERLKAVKELQKELQKELKTNKPEIKPNMTVEKCEKQIIKLEERITNTRLQLKDKEDNSQVALGTSKMNYIDPRMTVMFSKKYGVPIEKLFTKTLRDKFNWAIQSADENWRF